MDVMNFIMNSIIFAFYEDIALVCSVPSGFKGCLSQHVMSKCCSFFMSYCIVCRCSRSENWPYSRV